MHPHCRQRSSWAPQAEGTGPGGGEGLELEADNPGPSPAGLRGAWRGHGTHSGSRASGQGNWGQHQPQELGRSCVCGKRLDSHPGNERLPSLGSTCGQSVSTCRQTGSRDGWAAWSTQLLSQLCGEGLLITWGFRPPDQMDPTGTASELALLEGSRGGRGTENGAWGWRRDCAV